jgi:hypothetical protein
MKAARFAVYNAKNTTANRAQILDINLKGDKYKHNAIKRNMNTNT